MNRNRIILIHSLNDFSGSPNVLSMVARGLVGRDYAVVVITNRGTGFLSGIQGVKYNRISYFFHKNRVLTFFHFLICQIQLFFKIIFEKRRNTIYYINTITPVGAALACWLSGKKIVYHSHENMREKKPLYLLYRLVYRLCNQKTIFVSKYVESTADNCRNGRIVYNSIGCEFISMANKYIEKNGKTLQQTILMVASLKTFKGVYEFVELSKRFSQYQFELVLNATPNEVAKFARQTHAPINLKLYDAQKNLHIFYQRAKILLQMTNPTQWIETFGLTILEAMFYAVPSIVPNIGGPLELIEDGVNGFTLCPQDLDLVSERIVLLMENEELYNRFSSSALFKSKEFRNEVMIDKIEQYINE